MIKQFLSIMAGLLLFSYPLVAMQSPCVICNNRIPDIVREIPVILNCNHSYHPTCIHLWARTNPSCPQCHESVSPEQIAYFAFAANDHEEQHTWLANLAHHKKLQILCLCGGVAIILYLSRDKILNWLSGIKNNQIDSDLKPETIA